jgi:hypothetical protein
MSFPARHLINYGNQLANKERMVPGYRALFNCHHTWYASAEVTEKYNDVLQKSGGQVQSAELPEGNYRIRH